MALDTTTPRSRRAILAASLGGLAASVAAALGRPELARATDGQPIIQGANNSGSTSTLVRISSGAALQGLADATSGTNYGVRGRNSSADGAGVYGVGGSTTGKAVGVRGVSNSVLGIGVWGGAPDATYSGVRGQSDTSYGVEGWSGSGIGVYGFSTSSIGLYAGGGPTSQYAMIGQSFSDRTGILGFSGGGGYPASRAYTGVYGVAGQDATAVGVLGNSPPGVGVYGKTIVGRGVRGDATSGIGVHAVATTGFALAVSGRALFSRSAVNWVPINASYVDITVPGGLAASAKVLALLQANRSGVWVRGVRTNYPSSGQARIYLNKVASTSRTTPVAWFVLD